MAVRSNYKILGLALLVILASCISSYLVLNARRPATPITPLKARFIRIETNELALFVLEVTNPNSVTVEFMAVAPEYRVLETAASPLHRGTRSVLVDWRHIPLPFVGVLSEAPPGKAVTIDIPMRHLNSKSEIGIQWSYRLGTLESVRTLIMGFGERILGQRSSLPNYERYGTGLELVPIPEAPGR